MHISGGQKQRVAIARAVACGADVILADEPTGALDSKTGSEIMQLFTELNRQGKTIVLITHDKKVASYAKRLISIEDGGIIKVKRCKNIVTLVIAACMLFALSACSSQVFETFRSFEYHFMKEEYEEEYSKVEKTIELDKDANYKIKIVFSKESGTIAMTLSYMNEDGKIKFINMTSPVTETLK